MASQSSPEAVNPNKGIASPACHPQHSPSGNQGEEIGDAVEKVSLSKNSNILQKDEDVLNNGGGGVGTVTALGSPRNGSANNGESGKQESQNGGTEKRKLDKEELDERNMKVKYSGAQQTPCTARNESDKQRDSSGREMENEEKVDVVIETEKMDVDERQEDGIKSLDKVNNASHEANKNPTRAEDGAKGEDVVSKKPDAPEEGNRVAPSEDSGPDGSVSAEDIQLVQNLIERCLQMYMAQEEVVKILKTQASIDPEFTKLVWSKLEEQNSEFFRCYYTRLKLKAQIIMFNHLLEQQVSVVQKMQHGFGGHINSLGTQTHGNGNASATSSGIPLFQGGGKHVATSGHENFVGGLFSASEGVDIVDSPGMPGMESDIAGAHKKRIESKDQVVPSSLQSRDFTYNFTSPIDRNGSTPLLSSLPRLDSSQELHNFANSLPTPGEHGLLPATSMGLSALNSNAPQPSLPRNFSLSDLEIGTASPTLRRNFSLEGLSDAAINMNSGGEQQEN